MTTEKNNIPPVKKKFKKRYYLYLFIALLIGVRIWLPYFIKNKLENAINSVEGYSCTIEDVDLALYRGAMIIQNLEIWITTNEVEKPYVAITEAELGVHLRALLDGAIVGQIIVTEPVINFYDGDEPEDKQVGDVSWVKPIQEFSTLTLNHFEIINGTVNFENIGSNPPVALRMSEINFSASNLTNSKDLIQPLPSEVIFTAKLMDSGAVELEGNMNIIKDVPDLDIDATIKNVNLVEFNKFTTAYAHFNFENGLFEMATEIAMKDSKINGYVKPVLKDVKIFSMDEEGSFRNKLWQAALGIAVEITENQKKDQSSTKIPFEGNYTDPEIGVLFTILGVLENMLIKAYVPKPDHTIDFFNFNKKEGLKEKVEGMINGKK